MNNALFGRIVSVGGALVAGGLLAASLAFPLWHLRMEAPQYRDQEALKVAVYPNALRGDLNEIKTLNQYIGVRVPDALPQMHWLPTALLMAAVLGVLATFLPHQIRRGAGLAVPALLSIALLTAAIQAQAQMYRIGHDRSKSKLVGVKDFTPPFLGETKIAQFTVTSGFSLGAYLIGAAIVLQGGGALIATRKTAQPEVSETNQEKRSTAAPASQRHSEQEDRAFDCSKVVKGHAQ